MTSLRGRNILVLGGSGVLGSLIAKGLIDAGAQVMATTSTNANADRIPSAASPRLLLDLNNPESIAVLVQYLVQSDAQIDGIVNATGLVAFGEASALDAATLARLTSVNFTGPASVISGLIGNLRKSAQAGNEPFVVNISGIVAEKPMAGMAAYSATKSALFAFNQALGRELRKDGIRVIDARPGHTETGLAGRAIAGTAPAFATGMTPESVSARIVNSVLTGETDLPSTAFGN